MGLPMAGAGAAGDGDLLMVLLETTFAGLCGLGGTTGGGASLVGGLPTLMLRVDLDLAGVVV